MKGRFRFYFFVLPALPPISDFGYVSLVFWVVSLSVCVGLLACGFVGLCFVCPMDVTRVVVAFARTS